MGRRRRWAVEAGRYTNTPHVRTHVASDATPVVLRECVQGIDKPVGYGKPAGFWYQVDGDWERWCLDEQFELHALGHRFAVELNDCNVLKLNTAADIDAFHAEYAAAPPFEMWPGGPQYWLPAWDKLADEFDGLEITPYRWDRRLDLSWYYSWDCASGVIWRPRNAKVTHLEPIVLPEEVQAKIDEEARYA